MSIADKFIREGAVESVEGSSKKFLGSEDFNNGITLVAVDMQIFTPDDTKYGVKNEYGAGGVLVKENWLVKNGVLKEGESFRYVFKTEDGSDAIFENNSLSMYFSFTKANPNAGEKINIKRTANSQFDIDWAITKVQ